MKKSNGILILFLVLGLTFGTASVLAFNEAPMLAEKVAAGDLPPVDERLPNSDDVFVVVPVDRVGIYGGIARTATSVPTGTGDDTLMGTFPNPVRADEFGVEAIPHVMKSLESDEEAKVWTFEMREGMKWSDGHPFTTADVAWWYNYVLHNEDLTPVIGGIWRDPGTGGGPELNVIDETTFQFTWSVPRPFFPTDLIHSGFDSLYVPGHFLQDYHVEFADPDELAAKIRENGFDNWYELYGFINQAIWGTPLRAERPTITAFMADRITGNQRIWTRNPYFWKVDTAGNQLPYLDGITTEIVSDAEVVQGMIMSGQLDFAARMTDLVNYPMYRQFEEAGNYRTILWDMTYGTFIFYQFNQTVDDAVLREIFRDRRFRQAMSLAIDRDEMNDMLYFGQGTPRQYTVLDDSPYFEPEFATMYAEYDPDEANRLLDEIGLDRRDASGYRLRPDGQVLMFELEYVDATVSRTPNVELVQQYWQEIGIDVRVREISGELMTERAPANLVSVSNWHGDRGSHIMFPAAARYFIVAETSGWEGHQWPLWADYWNTNGRTGEEPLPEVQEMYEWYLAFLQAPEDQQVDLAKKILRRSAEEVYLIGTVGGIPHPIIINKDLRNFPETGLWGWDMGVFNLARDPEQMFFDR